MIRKNHNTFTFLSDLVQFSDLSDKGYSKSPRITSESNRIERLSCHLVIHPIMDDAAFLTGKKLKTIKLRQRKTVPIVLFFTFFSFLCFFDPSLASWEWTCSRLLCLDLVALGVGRGEGSFRVVNKTNQDRIGTFIDIFNFNDKSKTPDNRATI